MMGRRKLWLPNGLLTQLLAAPAGTRILGVATVNDYSATEIVLDNPAWDVYGDIDGSIAPLLDYTAAAAGADEPIALEVRWPMTQAQRAQAEDAAPEA